MEASGVVVHFRLPGERVITVVGSAGATVRDVAVDSAVPGIVGECGGNCSCATCHVVVDESWREPVGGVEPGSLEDGMLEVRDDRTPASRLSCQIRLTSNLDGLVVHVPSV